MFCCHHLQEPDDDEITNSKAGARLQGQPGGTAAGAVGRRGNTAGRRGNTGERREERRGSTAAAMNTSQWIIDGDELPRADIEVRCVYNYVRGRGGRGRRERERGREEKLKKFGI